jgi:hypothetical protein
MTAIEQAIEDAVEKGGWKQPGDGWISCDLEHTDHYFLNPLFWQALGKARGWKGITERTYYCASPNEVTNLENNNPYNERYYFGGYLPKVSVSTMNAACKHWHDFIDHLAEGKDAESFFATL